MRERWHHFTAELVVGEGDKRSHLSERQRFGRGHGAKHYLRLRAWKIAGDEQALIRTNQGQRPNEIVATFDQSKVFEIGDPKRAESGVGKMPLDRHAMAEQLADHRQRRTVSVHIPAGERPRIGGRRGAGSATHAVLGEPDRGEMFTERSEQIAIDRGGLQRMRRHEVGSIPPRPRRFTAPTR